MNANSVDDLLDDSLNSTVWFSWTKSESPTAVACPASNSESTRDGQTSVEPEYSNVATPKLPAGNDRATTKHTKINTLAKIERFYVPMRCGKDFDRRKYQLHLCDLIRRGLWKDFKRRLRHYPSDFTDAFMGPPRTIRKTIATVCFLYFAILLPSVAFSSLNLHQTNGQVGDLRKTILGQAIGGLGFAMLGGQPLVIIMTTAPLCLYTKGKGDPQGDANSV